MPVSVQVQGEETAGTHVKTLLNVYNSRTQYALPFGQVFLGALSNISKSFINDFHIS